MKTQSYNTMQNKTASKVRPTQMKGAGAYIYGHAPHRRVKTALTRGKNQHLRMLSDIVLRERFEGMDVRDSIRKRGRNEKGNE